MVLYCHGHVSPYIVMCGHGHVSLCSLVWLSLVLYGCVQLWSTIIMYDAWLSVVLYGYVWSWSCIIMYDVWLSVILYWYYGYGHVSSCIMYG